MSQNHCRVIVVFTLALCCRPALAATPAQYDGALAQVQSAIAAQVGALHSGRALPPAQAPGAVAARVLTPIIVVERPGGAAQPVDSRLLVNALNAATVPVHAAAHAHPDPRIAQLQAVSGQITVLRHDLQTPSALGSGPAAVLAAHRVLAENVYKSDPLPPPGLLDKFAAWLDRMLEPNVPAPSPTRA